MDSIDYYYITKSLKLMLEEIEGLHFYYRLQLVIEYFHCVLGTC